MQLDQPLAVITRTLDGSVLTVMSQTNESFTTGQLIRLIPKGSDEGLRQVLRRLTEQGIVISQQVGNAYSYQFNHSHVAAPHIAALSNARSEVLAKIEHHVSTWPVPPAYAAVFGSAVRGRMTPASDIDLLLIRPDDAEDEQWDPAVNELLQNALRWTGNDLRPLEFTMSDLMERLQEPVIIEIAQTGLTIAGQPNWLRRLVRQDGNR